MNNIQTTSKADRISIDEAVGTDLTGNKPIAATPAAFAAGVAATAGLAAAAAGGAAIGEAID